MPALNSRHLSVESIDEKSMSSTSMSGPPTLSTSATTPLLAPLTVVPCPEMPLVAMMTVSYANTGLSTAWWTVKSLSNQ